MLTLYRSLLHLYPAAYRYEYADEMICVFGAAEQDVKNRTLKQRTLFYAHEIGGVLNGVLCERLRALIGSQLSSRRFAMRPEFRFPRSTVFLMALVLTGVVLAIAKATTIELAYGSTLGTVWPALPVFYLVMLLMMSAVAATVWGVLFALHRTGMHRLANMQIGSNQK